MNEVSKWPLPHECFRFLPGLFLKLSFPKYAWTGGLPTIRSYVNKAKRDVLNHSRCF